MKSEWRNVFKECDIRGVYPEEIDEDFAFHLGRAIATEVEGGKVVLAGDVRISTPSLMEALEHGLIRSGANVANLGILPTPVAYFGASLLDSDACVIVTASHNPPRYNGMKIAFRRPVAPADLERLRDRMDHKNYLSARGQSRAVRVLDAYLESLTGRVGDRIEGTVRAVIDCGGGCFSEIAPAFLAEWGVDVVPLFCELDGRFSRRHPNPSIPEHLDALCSRVVAEKADIGIAFDGDGDRMVFVDERGCFVSGDDRVCILASAALRGCLPGEKVVYDIKCSWSVREIIAAGGGIPLMERSGHAFIKRRMINEKALFGGELSGHYFYRGLGGGDDGLYSACLILKETVDRSVSERVEELPHYWTTPDLRIEVQDREDVLARLYRAHEKAAGFCRLDGVRVENEQGWGLARVSVTEPVVTLRFEARSPDDLLAVVERFIEPAPSIRDVVREKVCQFIAEKQSELKL